MGANVPAPFLSLATVVAKQGQKFPRHIIATMIRMSRHSSIGCLEVQLPPRAFSPPARPKLSFRSKLVKLSTLVTSFRSLIFRAEEPLPEFWSFTARYQLGRTRNAPGFALAHRHSHSDNNPVISLSRPLSGYDLRE